MKKTIFAGLWKFADRLPIEDIEKLAHEWAQDDRYTQIYIRGAAKDQTAIGVMYNAGETADSRIALEEYIHESSDALRRRFGNDLVGWDFGSNAEIIK